MANELILNAGTSISVTIPLKLPPMQMRALFRRYCLERGIDIAGKTDAVVAELALRRGLLEMASVAKERQRKEERAQQAALFEEKVKTENDLVDEPPLAPPVAG